MKRSVAAIVVEPRTLVREGLVSLLHDSDFRVISAVPTLDQVPEAAFARASLLTVGASNETAEVFDYVSKSCSGARKLKIVVVAEIFGKVPQSDILKFLHAGADCCIVNVHSRDILLKAMHLAVLGQLVVVVGQDSLAGDAAGVETKSNCFTELEPRMNGGHAAHLSTRESEILKLIAAGQSNKVIARNCKLAESTVKIHLKAILRKICVQNRTQAAIWALQHAGCGELHEQIVPLSPEHSSGHPIQVGSASHASVSHASTSHASTSVIDWTGDLNGKSPSRR